MPASLHPVAQRQPLTAGQGLAVDIDQHHHIDRFERVAVVGDILRSPERLLGAEAANLQAGEIGRRGSGTANDDI